MRSTILTGKAVVMGDHMNTDVLHPSRFYSLNDAKVRSGFMQAASGYEQIGSSDVAGRIILAGDNFGCGSSRETGARVFLLAGVQAVVARSLARIFSRNLRNLGLPAIECPALDVFPDNESDVEIDLLAWTLSMPSLSRQFPLSRLDPYWEAVLQAGGLMPFLGLESEFSV